MKIIENFLFRNEYDLLEIKLSTEYDQVDKFVIVESDYTFTGTYKGYNIPKQIDRYSKWWDKVTYLQVGKLNGSAWDVERQSREYFKTEWKELSKEDVVVISDLDEIIRPEALHFIRDTNYDFYRLGMPFFNFKFNYLNIEGHTPWSSVKAFRGYICEDKTLGGMRGVDSVPDGKHVFLDHCGWHFSYLGDEAWINEKMQSYSHAGELELPSNINFLINQGKDFAARDGFKFAPVKLDNYFPKNIIENKDKYDQFILQNADKTLLDYLPGSIPKIISEY